MKMLKKLFFIPVLALFLVGCGGNQSEGEHDHGHSVPEVQEDGTLQKIDKTGPEYTAAYVCPMHCDGSGNIDADPLFTDPANGDYSLQACSPAIDAGSNSHYSDLDEDTKDLAGHPRVYDFGEGTIDMGPYEFQGAQINYDDVVFGDETVVYNASAQTIEAEDVPAETEVSYILLDSKGDTISQAVEAGAYTVLAIFTGCGPEEVLSAQLTITPAALTITAHSG